MNRKLYFSLLPVVALCGCTHHVETQNDINLKPIEVKPVRITVDVNLNVKVDKALDSSFNEVDKTAAGKPGALAPVVTEPAQSSKPGELTPIMSETKQPNPVKDAAIARIKARVAQIDAFKASGILGESNAGFLGLIKANAEAKTLAETENGDRWTVYQEIAKQKNVTPDAVAKRRALRNIERAPAGTWIQSPENGKWQQKTTNPTPAATTAQPASGQPQTAAPAQTQPATVTPAPVAAAPQGEKK